MSDFLVHEVVRTLCGQLWERMILIVNTVVKTSKEAKEPERDETKTAMTEKLRERFGSSVRVQRSMK